MKRFVIILLSLAVLTGTVWYTNNLAARFADEEKHNVEIWAEATSRFIMAEPGDDIDFISTIIEGNTTIPVFMTDADGHYMLCRNVSLPRHIERSANDSLTIAYYQARIDRLKVSCTPIEVNLGDDVTQYIYYDESDMLRHLHALPYVQLLLIISFLLVVILLLRASYRADENKLWVGLSKETAHQLGTPISSLMAWSELLHARYPDDDSFKEIDVDLHRLLIITDRFSKIGSRPSLMLQPLLPVVSEAVEYMRHRTSDKMSITLESTVPDGAVAELNRPLFSWVLENLIKNSVDATDGQGNVELRVSEVSGWRGGWYAIDVTDNGKGIERRNFRRVFRAGFTTKQRGWGLGLSLARRIVRDYHHGRIFVLRSEAGKATTFRILLHQRPAERCR